MTNGAEGASSSEVGGVSLPGEGLGPEEQAEVNRLSGEAQDKLSKTEHGRDFVRRVNGLPRAHGSRDEASIDVTTLNVQRELEGDLGLIQQFLGTPDEPIIQKEDPELGTRIEIFPGRSALHKGGVYLEVVYGESDQVARAQVGYPIQERMKHYRS